MSKCGKAIRRWRDRRGWSQNTLGELSGITQPQISRFERGGSFPSEAEIEAIASALGLTGRDLEEYLQACANETDESEDISPPTLSVISSFGNFADQLVRWSLEGRPAVAPTVFQELRRYAEDLIKSGETARSDGERLLIKLLMARVTSLTETVSGSQIRTQTSAYLRQIAELAHVLEDEDDTINSDLSRVLPAMVFYVGEQFTQAAQVYRAHMTHLSDPLVTSIALRDQIVIAGMNRTDRAALGEMRSQAEDIAVKQSLGSLGQAQISEGIARALIFRGNIENAQSHIEQAKSHYLQVQMQSVDVPFLEAQIARTAFEFSIARWRDDEESVIRAASEAFRLAKAKEYMRLIADMREMLLATNSQQLKEFVQSVIE